MCDEDVLLLGERVRGLGPELASQAGLLEAAERRPVPDRGVGVDTEVARLDRACHAQGATDVAGEDRPRQAVLRVVGEPDRVGLVVEGHDRDERAEHLLAPHGRLRVLGDHDRGADEVPDAVVGRAARDDLQAGGGGSALDAVAAAVQVLEDDPHFNAGRGAVGKNFCLQTMSNVHLFVEDEINPYTGTGVNPASVDDFQGVLRTEPDHDFARGNLLHCRMHCCDWRGYDGERNLVEETLRAGKKVVTPFPFQAISSSPADLRKCSEIFVADSYPAKMPVWKGERYTHDKIRIGYVGDSFREQATSYLTVGMFEHHDKSRFEIYAFDNGGGDGGTMRRRLEAAFDRFVDIGPLPDADAAAAIRRCEIDILVNLNGYFGKDRTGVFALRPAPLQVNYLGFPATLGASYFDYIVADEIVIPREHEPFYVEKISWLPECYQSNDDKRPIAAVPPTRAQAGLPDDAFVFCCFNNSYKFTPATFDTWMRILGQVPNSVLWILESNKALAPNLKHEAEARGVSGDRIVFAPFVKPEEHLARGMPQRL